MALLSLESPYPTESLAPRLVVLLDSEGQVECAKSTHSDPGFNDIPECRHQCVHEFLHAGCTGGCGFPDLWSVAWQRLQQEDFVEWEFNDEFLDKLLRFNLTRPPTSRDGARERRRRNALLTIRDITRYRKAHEALRQREEELVALVRRQSVDLARAQNQLDVDGSSGELSAKLLADFERRIRQLSRSVIIAQENERKRIAADLHDGIAQSLTILKLNTETVIEKMRSENAELDPDMLNSIVEQIRTALEEVRRISWALAPTQVDDLGLNVAIEWLCQQTESHTPGVDVKCDVKIDEADLPGIVQAAVYRIVQEALRNSTRHAQATKIEVELRKRNGSVLLSITDNGEGFSEGESPSDVQAGSGMGLQSMTNRAAATRGSISIDSEPGRGTSVLVEWRQEDLCLLAD